jgi:hypothetical protein
MPTSSVVPISDVQAERRLYLPFLGLVLTKIAQECFADAKRRLDPHAAAMSG